MSEHDRLDPRYRPEFQRGYDPGLHGAVEKAAPAAEPQRVEAPPVQPALTPPAVEELPAPDAALPIDQTDSPALAPPATPPWRNPYLIGLLVLGIALIAVGIDRFTWAVNQLYSTFRGTDGVSEVDLVTPQVMWALGPLLAIAGMLTLLGVGFFVAWRWVPGRRRGARDTQL